MTAIISRKLSADSKKINVTKHDQNGLKQNGENIWNIPAFWHMENSNHNPVI